MSIAHKILHPQNKRTLMLARLESLTLSVQRTRLSYVQKSTLEVPEKRKTFRDSLDFGQEALRLHGRCQRSSISKRNGLSGETVSHTCHTIQLQVPVTKRSLL